MPPGSRKTDEGSGENTVSPAFSPQTTGLRPPSTLSATPAM